jgi:hypothetical protein
MCVRNCHHWVYSQNSLKKIFILSVFLGDDGTPPMKFYKNLKTLAQKVTLNDAQAALSALPDSDVEDETENVQENSQSDGDDTEEVLDNGEEDEDNIPLAQLFPQKSKAKMKNEKKNVTWKKNQFLPPNIVFTPSENNDETAHEYQTPMMYFAKYFPNEIFMELAEKTNMYSIHKTGKIINTNVEEIRKFVALHIVMGIIRFPRLRMYWTPATKIQFIDDIQLPRNRFEALRNNLHIVDVNEKRNGNDKLWKVRPIINSFEKRCEELVIEENVCIDESIIPFKGKLKIKQYMKGKPNPWGVKVFMLCGASGIIYRSIVYQGSTTLPVHLQESYSATNGLVMHLASRIPEQKGHKLFCDNYFTSLLLLQELLEKGVFVAGTIRTNRLEKCPLKLENQLKKSGRGSNDSFVTDDEKVVVVRWYDNKCVNMASNFVGIEPEDEVRRWDRKEGAYVMVKRPAIIRMYNSSMGGVDKSDFLIALYRTFIRSRKWTLRVIFHYFNLAVCNAWLEHQSVMERGGEIKKDRMDLLEFAMSIAKGLALSGSLIKPPKRGRPSSKSPRNSPVPTKRKTPHTIPVDDIRYDNLGHWPIHQNGHEQRCKLETCGGRSRIECEKCKVALCLSKFKNCFKMFHTK